jgi:hypothetical protein
MAQPMVNVGRGGWWWISLMIVKPRIRLQLAVAQLPAPSLTVMMSVGSRRSTRSRWCSSSWLSDTAGNEGTNTCASELRSSGFTRTPI